MIDLDETGTLASGHKGLCELVSNVCDHPPRHPLSCLDTSLILSTRASELPHVRDTRDLSEHHHPASWI